MNNSESPATPVMDESDWGQHYGLTKREHFTSVVDIKDIEVGSEVMQAMIGRSIDTSDAEDMLKASFEFEAKLRVMKADTILAELDK